MILTLPIYYRQEFKKKPSKQFLVGLNWYRNAHHSLSNKVKHDYHVMVAEQLGDIKFKKVKVLYRVYAGRRGTDGHNIRAVIEKFFMDGVVEHGAIPDDNIDYVIGDSSEYYIDKTNPRIEIEIIEQQ